MKRLERLEIVNFEQANTHSELLNNCLAEQNYFPKV